MLLLLLQGGPGVGQRPLVAFPSNSSVAAQQQEWQLCLAGSASSL